MQEYMYCSGVKLPSLAARTVIARRVRAMALIAPLTRSYRPRDI